MKKAILLTVLFFATTGQANVGQGCLNMPGLVCLDQPGFYDGMELAIKKDLLISANQEVYFIDGRQINSDDMTASILVGETSYCGLHIATNQASEPLVPDTLRQNNLVKIPASLSPYKVDDVSWYVSGIFFTADTNNQKLSLRLICGKITNDGKMTLDAPTSLDEALKNLKGIIAIQ